MSGTWNLRSKFWPLLSSTSFGSITPPYTFPNTNCWLFCKFNTTTIFSKKNPTISYQFNKYPVQQIYKENTHHLKNKSGHMLKTHKKKNSKYLLKYRKKNNSRTYLRGRFLDHWRKNLMGSKVFFLVAPPSNSWRGAKEN